MFCVILKNIKIAGDSYSILHNKLNLCTHTYIIMYIHMWYKNRLKITVHLPKYICTDKIKATKCFN